MDLQLPSVMMELVHHFPDRWNIMVVTQLPIKLCRKLTKLRMEVRGNRVVACKGLKCGSSCVGISSRQS